MTSEAVSIDAGELMYPCVSVLIIAYVRVHVTSKATDPPLYDFDITMSFKIK